ncbi:phage major capsid protein, P2 family [Croceicoccus estronivorus]|uniref:phage major capsid protein, P2 family n=1 Tax=Croceicoccus estronivorus TaxID=1172626 RepID=UPI00083779D8|nr:phage major capsid protein, P2 family [Croceicoccus estronivorus]OCC25300.1 phage major capsid protein, P2 family [Croceicoccus estronivorus]
MRNETRELFHDYLGQVAELNGVQSATEQFTVDPSIQQVLIDLKQEDPSSFLGRINVRSVPEMLGETLGMDIGQPIASRTDTSGEAERKTTDPSTLSAHGFQLFQTDYDTHLTYGKLDQWAKFKDFEQRIQRLLVSSQRRAHVMIGFNGTSAAATTNRVANPKLQDVNKGWLQKLREDRPAQVMTESTAASGKVTYGPGGDYATLDALVWDAINELLPVWAQDDTQLTAFVSRDLLKDKYFPLINEDRDPTEQLARDTIMATKRLGGLPAERPYAFPTGTIFISSHENLSIYEQEGKRRRTVIDNPKKNRVENFESSNDAYPIEDYDFACLIENVEYAE